MAREENCILTNMCMIYDGNRILVQDRMNPDWPGITFPGGHIESGESFVDAVIREMKEETGLTIVNPKLCGIKQFPIDGGRYIVLLFKAEEFSGELVSSEEGQMEWIHRNDLENINTVNDLKELLYVMEEDSMTEFQYVIEDKKWIAMLK